MQPDLTKDRCILCAAALSKAETCNTANICKVLKVTSSAHKISAEASCTWTMPKSKKKTCSFFHFKSDRLKDS